LHPRMPMFRRLWHRPHVHRNRPVRLDCCLPNSGEYNLAVWPDQIVVTLCNMWTETFDM
jgi:hypothetical protein